MFRALGFLSFVLMFGLNASSQEGPRVRDIGVLGLFSHDVFAWDHENEVNSENGVLDLSTIFDYDDGSRWKKGGNPKNEENAPVYTFTMELVEYYLWKSDSMSKEEARKETVKYFIQQVFESYQRLVGAPFDHQPLLGSVTNTEQAVLRGMHDILPGWINLYRNGRIRPYKVTSFFTRKKRLNEWEMQQGIPHFKGEYDPEYEDINVIFARINLKQIDADFIAAFSPYTQQMMLQQLKEFGQGNIAFSELSFGFHFNELIAKSIHPQKSHWLPQVSVSVGPSGQR